MKKGFTLIELLSVIVILAIISVIAIPIVLNIVENSEESSNEISMQMYAKAVKIAIVNAELDGNAIKPGVYNSKTIETIGNLEVEYDGKEIFCDTIRIYEDGNIYLSDFIIDGNNVDFSIGKLINDETELNDKYDVAIGDYVNYDCFTGVDSNLLTYEVTADQTGQYGRSFNSRTQCSSSDLKWRVMGIEDGKVLLLSNTAVNAGFGFYGEQSYMHAVEVLDGLSATYGHGVGAVKGRALRVEDVNELVGYYPTKTVWTEGEISEYGNVVTVTNGANGVSFSSSNKINLGPYNSSFRYYDENTNTFKDLAVGESIQIKNSRYRYNITDYITSDSSIYEMLMTQNQGVNEWYLWLASREVAVDDEDDIYVAKYGIYHLQVRTGAVAQATRIYSHGTIPDVFYAQNLVVVELDPNVVFEKQADGSWNIVSLAI